MVPFMFQDDLVNGTEGLEQARETNRKVNCLVKERGLQLNKDKSVRQQVKSDPLMCGNFETKEVQVEKWLGQMFSAQGLADSVAKTVAARTGKIKAACLEITQIVNDWRSQAVGGMTTALVLWEACCIPSLLHGTAPGRKSTLKQ